MCRWIFRKCLASLANSGEPQDAKTMSSCVRLCVLWFDFRCVINTDTVGSICIGVLAKSGMTFLRFLLNCDLSAVNDDVCPGHCTHHRSHCTLVLLMMQITET